MRYNPFMQTLLVIGALAALSAPVAAEPQDAQIRQLVKDLHAPFDQRKKRAAASDALAKIGTPAIPALIATLRDKEMTTSWAARDTLANIGKPAVPALAAAFREKESFVRFNAGVALARIGEPAVETLLDALKGKTPPNLTIQENGLSWSGANDDVISFDAASALGRIGKPAVPALVKALKQKPAWSVNALMALWHAGKGAGEATSVLIEALSDKNKTTRALAAATLGRIGVPAKAAAPALVKALKDADAIVRAQAKAALKSIDAK